jgi:MFS family permease
MLITRKTEVPRRWAFYAQLTLILSIYGNFVVNAPFILLMKRYIDNPAAIMGLISIQIYVTFLGGPLTAWLSDRIWTKYGRRKVFVASSDAFRALFLLCMPFAPNLWTLVACRWLFDFFGDLGSPTQALIYEIVPAKQRSRAAGYMSAFMNVGNLVFFTLLLGRFHDVYFMGPFRFFGTPSGGTIMFLLCVILFAGAALFEAIGVKETYPPGRKRLSDGRKPGENIVKHFLRSVFADVFAKDLMPLYLLLVANTMFGFSLGVFQPLLFTEQWGYDLQTFGNTIAIGVPLGIVLGLVGGWVGDKFGKLRVVLVTTIGNLVVNLIYTAYVYYQPGYRPSFWEIVAFGNLAFIFGGINGVSYGPLLWEFVARNRMGGATAGIVLFNAIIRNSVGLIVGFWLLVWSIWFHPQAGYNVTAVFTEEMNLAAVQAKAVEAGLELNSLQIRPKHPPGTSRPALSRRWWIHQENPQATDWIKERETLQDQIGKWQSRINSFTTSEARKEKFRAEIVRARSRISAIDAELVERSNQLEARLATVLEPLRFRPGEQIRSLRFEGSRLELEVSTLEALDPAYLERLRDNLRGQEFLTLPVRDDEGLTTLEPQLDISILPRNENGLHGIRLQAEMDPRFISLFQASVDAGMRPDRAFNLAAGFVAVATSQFTTRESDFLLEDIAPSLADGEGGAPGIRLTLRPTRQETLALFNEAALRDLFRNFDAQMESLRVSTIPGAFQIVLVLKPFTGGNDKALPFEEVRARLSERLDGDPLRVDISLAVFRKLADTLSARPLFVNIPRYEVESGYSKRAYEYFFSSQILQMGTDVFGILILFLILKLEKRGVLTRHGAQEDDNR